MFSGTAANLRSLFHGRVLNLLKGLTVGQAVPEIPQRRQQAKTSPNFRILPRIFPRMHIACRVYMYTCIIIIMIIIISIIYNVDRGAEGFAL